MKNEAIEFAEWIRMKSVYIRNSIDEPRYKVFKNDYEYTIEELYELFKQTKDENKN